MTAPSDLELMMYFDDELDEARRSEVRDWLEASAGGIVAVPPPVGNAREAARSKLVGLSMVGLAVREGAVATGLRAKDLADSVMAATGADTGADIGADTEPAVLQSKGSVPAKGQEPRALKIGLDKHTAPAAPAANDNNKFILGLAGLAAAAAAALFIWGRSPVTEDLPRARTSASGDAVESIAAVPSDPVPAPVAQASSAPDPDVTAPTGEDEPARSVEVAAVDFGSRPGFVYYDVSGNDTTVVWVRDEQ